MKQMENKDEIAFSNLVEAIKNLDWVIATPKNPREEDMVEGLIVGTVAYVQYVIDELNIGDSTNILYYNESKEENTN